LPLVPFRSVLRPERRVSHEGMVSVGGNYYSVPDTTRRRVLEVQELADGKAGVASFMAWVPSRSCRSEPPLLSVLIPTILCAPASPSP
jgi:hypothetical protein